MIPTGLEHENDCPGEDHQQLNDRSILSRERMLHKNFDRKCSIEKKLLVMSLKGLVA
jgi:hypothetical protein